MARLGRREIDISEQPISLLGRLRVSGRAVLVRLLAMLEGRSGMLLRFFDFADLEVMRGLVMVMHGRVVVAGGMVMMLARRMLRGVRHIYGPPLGLNASPGQRAVALALD